MSQTDGSGDEFSDPDEAAAADWFSEERATFGDRLAGAREAAGISQRELAQRIGIKTGTLRKWEDDQAEPRANRLSMLAGMLGVSLTWLMTGKGDGPEAPVDILPEAAEIKRLLDEMRLVRGQIEAQATRLAALEKHLRRAIKDM